MHGKWCNSIHSLIQSIKRAVRCLPIRHALPLVPPPNSSRLGWMWILAAFPAPFSRFAVERPPHLWWPSGAPLHSNPSPILSKRLLNLFNRVVFSWRKKSSDLLKSRSVQHPLFCKHPQTLSDISAISTFYFVLPTLSTFCNLIFIPTKKSAVKLNSVRWITLFFICQSQWEVQFEMCFREK